ncbi:MAG: TRAP transporter permease, partial [Dehalococcoidia bacterium]
MPQKILTAALATIALGAVAYHMTTTQYLLVSTTAHKSLHLAFILSLVLLGSLRKSTKLWPATLLLYAAGLVGVGYMLLFEAELEERYGFPTLEDLAVGVVLIVVVLEATRRGMGLAIPILAMFFIGYASFGHYLPPVIRAYDTDFDQLFHVLTTDGIYGTLLGISANYIFLFVVFGGLLQALGISRLFREIGILVGRAIKSGPAMMAVVGSGLIGSVTMSPSANIAITGSYTIPLMKSAGYKPHQAAAIEAAASTGGQIMPPIMSTAAFLMASMTGIAYVRVIAAGFVPALLYFFAVGIYAHLQALKLGIVSVRERINWRELLLESRLFLVPVGVIVSLLVLGFTPMYTVFWAMIALIVMGLIRGSTRPSFRQWVDGFINGAVMGAQIGLSLAALGIVVKVVTITGLGIRLPGIVETLSGGNFLPAMGLIALVTLILGTGVPTPAAYILVALITAPVVIEVFGLSLLQAHYFVFYFAVMSMLTPPVAPAAFVSSALAGSTFMRVAVEQVKPALAGFVLPLAFIWTPMVLGEPKNIWEEMPMLLSLMAA